MCIQLAIRHFGPSNALDVVRLAVDMIVNADAQDLTFVTTDIGYVQKSSKNEKCSIIVFTIHCTRIYTRYCNYRIL